MRLRLAISVLLVALCSGLAAGQSARVNSRGAGGGIAVPGGNCSGGCAVLTSGDFTYLGANTVAATTPVNGWATNYGNGLALRYEPSDGTNQVHLMMGAQTDGTHTYPIFEVRDAAPENPGTPTNLGSYTNLTTVKEYSGTYVGADTNFKRLAIASGVEGNWDVSSGPDWFGLLWDSLTSRLCWNYIGTYGTDSNSWHFGCSTINYAAGTAVATGPYRLTGQGPKAAGGGMLSIPSWYATSYLSGRNIGLGCGGYGSLEGVGDVSRGPSLTAVVEPTSWGAEKSTLANTAVLGYWPVGGAGVMNTRPAILDYYDHAGASTTEWTITDETGGCVWIDTGTKHGVLFFSNIGTEATGYLSSDRYATSYDHYWAIYDPAQLTPVSGTSRHSVMPASFVQKRFAFLPTGSGLTNYYDCAVTVGTAGATSSTNTVVRSQSNSTGGHITLTSHGLSGPGSQVVVITGNSNSQYNGFWIVGDIINANEFVVYSPNDSGTWNGTSGSGGTVKRTGADFCGYRTYVKGAAYDPLTKILYVRVGDPLSKSVIAKWQVN